MEEMAMAIEVATTPVVKMWMNWMMAVFATSLIFSWKYKPARIVLASFVLSMPAAILVFSFTQSVHLIGMVHILIWGPLAYYLIVKVVKHSSFKLLTFFGVWVSLLLGTIAISLVFDVRDVAMVVLGMK